MIRGAFRSLLLTLSLLVPSASAAQVEGAIDLGFSTDYVWRGLTRVSRATVQPALALAWKGPALMISAGGWALVEPWRPGAGDLTLAGQDGGLAEVDVWTEGDYRLRLASAVIDLRGGWTRYTFHGDPASGGLGDARDASELFLGARLSGLGQLYTIVGLPSDLPIGVDASAAFDLGPVGGTYVETALVSRLPVLFVGEPLGSLVARLAAGWSWNQDPEGTGGTDPEPARYEGEGLTHVQLSLGATPFFQPAGIPMTLHLDGTVQLGIDGATRRRGPDPGDEARVTARLDVALSILYPLRRTP